jgi:HlyD family secretion protein
MKRTVLTLLLLIVLGVAGGVAWWFTHRPKEANELVLYGNVDLRQAQLAFNNSDRIEEVRVQEGDHVHKGELLARLDESRLKPQVAQAEAQVAAQRAVVERLHNGSRPEEIAQARAAAESAKADAAIARRTNDRLRTLDAMAEGAVSKQDLDNAKAVLEVTEAKLAVSQRALDLVVLGPRKEEIAENEAKLRANEAQLAFLKQQLADAILYAPSDGIIRTRLLEPGEMATMQKPVFSLAITDPKWVRAYVSETDLGKVHEGMKATIGVDSFPSRRFEGWVGFVSPAAEFTPKSVQTEELRTSLVYEVRVFVKDPSDNLRLGMPATVYLPLRQEAP